jgi:hypothetical protein
MVIILVYNLLVCKYNSNAQDVKIVFKKFTLEGSVMRELLKN